MEKNVLKVITDAMLEKKGQQVVSLDLSSIGTAISDYFVVCNADSTTAVAAIADNIIVRMEEKCGRKVLRMQGLENDFWIILDYGDIVVHVFLTQYREFYRLEDLWADAERVEYTDEPVVEQTVSEKRIKPKAASKVRASAKRVKNRDGE
ncbi:MAG: ribosome silencing factor [Bacteroidales bacterium]|nr:ribosome silencing factor [Bacteroidales bacterium]MDY2973551.1 ribosome silencing factor [Candidatus Cryptobacteroides sp.]MED9899214.1 ribosome silencing factor [Bacteroidales bacterium]